MVHFVLQAAFFSAINISYKVSKYLYYMEVDYESVDQQKDHILLSTTRPEPRSVIRVEKEVHKPVRNCWKLLTDTA